MVSSPAMSPHRLALVLALMCACPDEPGVTTAVATSDAMPMTGGSSDETTDTPTTGDAAGGAPVVMELLANVTTLLEDDPITFTAIVTDSDGLDTIVGGKLLTEDESGFYGAFSLTGGGTFQFVTTWDQLSQTAKIEFMGLSSERVFRADFQDLDGNHGAATVKITLLCPDYAKAACDGRCTELGDDENCSACGDTCQSFCTTDQCL